MQQVDPFGTSSMFYIVLANLDRQTTPGNRDSHTADEETLPLLRRLCLSHYHNYIIPTQHHDRHYLIAASAKLPRKPICCSVHGGLSRISRLLHSTRAFIRLASSSSSSSSDRSSSSKSASSSFESLSPVFCAPLDVPLAPDGPARQQHIQIACEVQITAIAAQIDPMLCHGTEEERSLKHRNLQGLVTVRCGIPSNKDYHQGLQ